MQSIIQLPRNLTWWGDTFGMVIENHEIKRIAAVSETRTDLHSIFDFLAYELHEHGSAELDRLSEMGVGYTAFIELCAQEIEEDSTAILKYANIILESRMHAGFENTGIDTYVIDTLREAESFEDMKHRLYTSETKKYMTMAHDAYIQKLKEEIT